MAEITLVSFYDHISSSKCPGPSGSGKIFHKVLENFYQKALTAVSAQNYF